MRLQTPNANIFIQIYLCSFGDCGLSNRSMHVTTQPCKGYDAIKYGPVDLLVNGFICNLLGQSRYSQIVNG